MTDRAGFLMWSNDRDVAEPGDGVRQLTNPRRPHAIVIGNQNCFHGWCRQGVQTVTLQDTA